MAQRRPKASSKLRSRSPRRTVEGLRRSLTREREQRKEALERERATSEILRVIAESQTDVQPVFEAILKSATELCEAHLGLLDLYDGERLRTVAQRGGDAEFAKWAFERGAFRPASDFAHSE